jgi:RNA polymerase sigma factor (sigma-70 family)
MDTQQGDRGDGFGAPFRPQPPGAGRDPTLDRPEREVRRIDGWLHEAAFVRGLARDLVATAADADDLVQETWLRSTRAPPRAGFPVRAWLAGLVRNVARERRRATERRIRHETLAVRDAVRGGGRGGRGGGGADGIAAASGLADPADDPARLAERLELARCALAEVAALDDASRAVVVAHYLDGRTLEEIARRRGEPSVTVRSRLKRALERLRERLDAGSRGGRAGWIAAFTPWRTSPAPLPDCGPILRSSPGWAPSVGATVLTAALVALIGTGAAWWWLGHAAARDVREVALAAGDGASREATSATGPRERAGSPRAERIRVTEDGEERASETRSTGGVLASDSVADLARWRVIGRIDGLDPALRLAPDAFVEVVAAPTSQVGLTEVEIVALAARGRPDDDGAFAIELPPFPQPSGEPPWWRGFSVAFRDPRHVDAERFVATQDASGALFAAPHEFQVELATRASAFASGRVVDDAGAPLAGVAVRWGEWDAADDPDDRQVRTDEAGLYRIESAALGATRLCAAIDDPWLAEESAIERRERWSSERAELMPAEAMVELRAGRETEAPDLVLRRGAAIRGRAIGRDGRSLAGALIEGHARIPAPTPGQQMPEIGWNRSTRSGPDGRFVLSGIAAAEWTLIVAEGPAEQAHPVVDDCGPAGAVKVVAPAEGVELRLSTIAVELTLCLDGQPLPGLPCTIRGFSPDRRNSSDLGARSDAAGRIRFAGASGCEFSLGFDRSDLEPWTPPFTLRADEEVHRRTLDLKRRRPRATCFASPLPASTTQRAK